MKIKPSEKTGGVIVELGPKETQLSPLVGKETTPALAVFQLKKILVPVDFTECTRKGLFYAVPFAKQFGAELTLLHVVEPPYTLASEMGGLANVESVADAERKLQKLCDELEGDVRCHILLREGNAQSEIVAVAKELGSDLMILSTHGRTGLERIVLGSVTEKVVRHANCPVLIVRENEHEFVAGGEADLQHGEAAIKVSH